MLFKSSTLGLVAKTASAIAAASLLAFAAPAFASGELFSIGSTFQIVTDGVPSGSFTDNVVFKPGTTLIAGGAISLTLGIVDSPTAEFVTFNYATVSGGAIGSPGVNWDVTPVGLPAAVPVDFTGNYLEFLSNGVAQVPSGSIFGGFSVVSNPVPGASGTGIGASGFHDIIPAGPLPGLGTYVDPWNFVDAMGIDSTKVNGFYNALEFANAAPVPEPSTWALAMAGLGLVANLARRRKHVAR